MKLCPLKFNSNGETAEGDYNCEKESCAWWDADIESCVVHNVGSIAETLWNG